MRFLSREQFLGLLKLDEPNYDAMQRKGRPRSRSARRCRAPLGAITTSIWSRWRSCWGWHRRFLEKQQRPSCWASLISGSPPSRGPRLIQAPTTFCIGTDGRRRGRETAG